jgi:hypothetical protein
MNKHIVKHVCVSGALVIGGMDILNAVPDLVLVKVRTTTQTYRETYREKASSGNVSKCSALQEFRLDDKFGVHFEFPTIIPIKGK